MLLLEKKKKLLNALEIAYKLHGDFVPWISSDYIFQTPF